MNSEIIHQIRTSIAEISAQVSALSAKLDELSARLAAAEGEILAPEHPATPAVQAVMEEPAAPVVAEEHSAPVMEEPVAPPMDIIDLDALSFLDEDLPAAEPEAEVFAAAVPFMEPEPSVMKAEPEPVHVAAEPEPTPAPTPEPTPAQEPAPAPEPEPEAEDEVLHRTTLKDMYEAAQSCRWMHDLPGGPVSNIISAISLNDRVLLITQLFREDPMLFNSSISAFNSMESLDQALEYINTNFPEWDLDSQAVYRLIMALRRKLS